MWLSKPVYESVPYYYMVLGLVAGFASWRIEVWYWSELFVALAAASIVSGLVLWLKRRDYRRSRSRTKLEE